MLIFKTLTTISTLTFCPHKPLFLCLFTSTAFFPFIITMLAIVFHLKAINALISLSSLIFILIYPMQYHLIKISKLPFHITSLLKILQ